MGQAILFRFHARGVWSAAPAGPSLVASDTFYGAASSSTLTNTRSNCTKTNGNANKSSRCDDRT